MNVQGQGSGFRMIGKVVLTAALCSCFSLVSPAQPAPPTPAREDTTPGDRIRLTYVLGPGDQIVIRAFQVDEISDKPFRINSEGDIDLPVLGKVHTGGLTVEQLEADLLNRLKALVVSPQVSVSVVEYRSEPVFLEGAFKSPGMFLLQGDRTLLELVARAGGLLPTASRKISITRRLQYGRIPLANSVTDEARKVSTVRINVESLRDNISPEEDIKLQPLDVINADPAELVYVSGEVNKAGSFELGERDWIPVTQLIAMVGGLGRDADASKARVLRPVLNSSRRSAIPVDLKKILMGKVSDFPVLPNDVLYIPRSSHKEALGRLAVIAVPAATGLIYVLASKL